MVQRKRSRKRSQRKRSLRKKSRKRSQSGGGFLNWYKKINKSTCQKIARKLLENNKYTKPEQFIIDYNKELSKKSGFFSKAGHIMKSGIFGVLSTGMGVITAFSFLPLLTKDGRQKMAEYNNKLDTGQIKTYDELQETNNELHLSNLSGKHGKKYVAGTALVALAIIAGIVYSNVKGKKKQGKMILQVACDEWNSDYPDQKININDITKLVSKNKVTKKIMTSIKKSKPDLIEHGFKTDKLMEKHGEFHHNSK
tara:strand:+ start:424 stop:1182 length:759 start_codon:yes stop_codon:yes gene_type:complete